jgi:hypothetical protein
VDAWWWVPIGLVAWLVLAAAAGLWLGPVFKQCSQAWEALAPDTGKTPSSRPKPPEDWQQAS